jgi:2-dehydropantoate 2-reductase
MIGAPTLATDNIDEIPIPDVYFLCVKSYDLDETVASINKANNFPFDTKTSYQRDIETKGPVNEGDIYSGTIIRMGEAPL